MGERLDSWKAIAAYLRREVRTAQRWAKDRDLPVHRLPGGRRPRVFALRAEIDAWLSTSGPAAPERGLSVAVLPFVNLAGEADLFGDGLAEDVIDELVRVPGLRVIARTSSFAFAGRGGDVREIGARLGAAWLVEGSVRRQGQRLRVSVQLVSTRDGSHAWSKRYDRSLTDVLAMQDQIARSVALALKLTLAPRRAAAGAPTDPTAYDLWIKGRASSQQFTPEALAEALACYEAAITRDPGFARPHFGLADLLFHGAMFGLAPTLTVLPRARQAILRCLELDGDFGEAHALLGVFRGLLDYDWPGAEAAFQRAFELSPGSAAVLSQHAWYHLAPRRQLDRAVAEAQQAVGLDPLSPFAHGILGMVLVVARRYERACEVCRTAIQLAPSLWWLHWFYGTALLSHGDVEEGLRECRGVCERIGGPVATGAMGAICGLFSRRQEAQELLRQLQEMARTVSVPPQAFALAYLGVGDERVFEFLDQTITMREPMTTLLPSLPIYDGLRGDPRFAALLARMNLG